MIGNRVDLEAIGAIARREAPVENVETIEAVVRVVRVAKGVQIGDPGAAVKVDPGMKAGPVVAADDRLKGSRKSNWRN